MYVCYFFFHFCGSISQLIMPSVVSFKPSHPSEGHPPGGHTLFSISYVRDTSLPIKRRYFLMAHYSLLKRAHGLIISQAAAPRIFVRYYMRPGSFGFCVRCSRTAELTSFSSHCISLLINYKCLFDSIECL